jgi:hypothetical protein
METNDEKIAEDFDIAWATMDGLYSTEELNRWNYEQLTDHRGSFASHLAQEYTVIKQPNIY